VSTAFNPADLWQPFSVFSMGVVQGGGRVVHLKGQIALDKTGRIVGKADMRAQTRKTLENIQAVLACVGGTMADIISLTQYVTDIDAFLSTRFKSCGSTTRSSWWRSRPWRKFRATATGTRQR